MNEYDIPYLWRELTINSKLLENFLRVFHDKIDMKWVVAYQDVSESFVRDFHDRVSWAQVSKKWFSEDLVRDFSHKICWYNLCFFNSRHMSEAFIREIQDFIPSYAWCHLFTDVERSKAFVEEFFDKIYSFQNISTSWYSKSKHVIEEVQYKKIKNNII